MRTGGGLVALGLAINAAAFAAPPKSSPDIWLSEGGVLEAKKPLTIGVRSNRRIVSVEARLAPDAAIARLYRDPRVRRSGRSLGKIGVPARGTEVHLDHESGGVFTAAVDLRPLIGDRRGAVVVDAFDGSDRVSELYQVTDLGLLVVRSPIRSIVQVLRLSTGAPVGGATILTLDPRGVFATRGTTDAGGVLTLDATADDVSLPPDPVLIARTADGDQVILLRRHADRNDRETRDRDILPAHTFDLVRGESIEASLFTDRGAYQRGEKVQIAGWAATVSAIHAQGLRPLPAGSAFRLTLARGKTTLATALVTVTAQGRLSGALAIPANAPAGDADLSLDLPLPGGQERRLAVHDIRIEAVRPEQPAIELRADRHELVRPAKARLTLTTPPGSQPITVVNYEMACEPIWRFRAGGVPDGWMVGDPAQKPTKVAGALVREVPRAEPATITIDTTDAPPAATSWCRVRATAHDTAGHDRTAETTLLVHPLPNYAAVLEEEQEQDPRHPTAKIHVWSVSAAGAPMPLPGTTLELEKYGSGALVPGSTRSLNLSNASLGVEVALPALDEKTNSGFWAVVRDAGGSVMSRTFVNPTDPTEPPPIAVWAPYVVRPGETFSVDIGQRTDVKRAGGLLAILGGGVQRAVPFAPGAGPISLEIVAGASFYPDVTLDAAIAYPSRNQPAHLAWLSGRTRAPQVSASIWVTVTAPHVAHGGERVSVSARFRRLNGAGVPRARAAIAVVSEAAFSRGRYAELASDMHFLDYRQDGSAHWDMFDDIVKPFAVTDGWSLGGLGTLGQYGHGCGGLEPPLAAPQPRWRDATVAFFPDLTTSAENEVAATFVAPATPGLYRVRVVVSAPLGTGTPPWFGTGNAWIDVR